MRLISFIILIVVVTLVQWSCKKERINEYSGTVSATKNGLPWSPLVRGNYNSSSRFSLNIDEFDGKVQVNGLSLLNIPYAGRHRIFRFDAMAPYFKVTAIFHDYWDGHAICTDYHVLESDSISNYIEVMQFDPVKKEVSGKFGIKLVLTGSCASGYPDTLHIKEGLFETKLK